jgi:hypothetical protein
MQSESFFTLRDIQTGERVLLQFRTEVFKLPNYENLPGWACGLNSGNSSSILGAPQLGYLTAASELAKFQSGLKLYYRSRRLCVLSQRQ